MDRQKRRASFSPGKRRAVAQPKAGSDDSSLTSKMKVVVRIRPPTENETNQNRSLVKPINEQKLIFDPKEEISPFFFQGKKQGRRDMLKKQNRALDFSFDRVFDASSSNNEVFEDTTKGILVSLLEGFNCSVFVYGATGAGKTFTMLGSDATPGITYLTMVELYTRIAAEAKERTFDVWVSYIEVYNENVRDLLKSKTAAPLTLRDDGSSGVNVAGLEVKTISDADQLLALLAQGNKNRTQHATDANSESSRSHAVFQVYIRMTNRRTGEVKIVKLSMIDLAGSERAAVSGCKGMRFKEGANINKSLLALGNCINGLADGLKHIPYRDSKLTRILKDSLGGNCHTIMIANVSPDVNSFEDTYNTLKYATRAKKIKTKIKRNIISVPLPAAQYLSIIEKLEAEIAELRSQVKAFKDGANIPGNSNQADMIDGFVDKRAEMVERLKPIYEGKKRYHIKIMELESKLQILKYRRYLKISDAQCVSELNSNNRELVNDMKRIYVSLNKYRVQIEALQQDLEAAWVQERRHDELLSTFLKDAEASGLRDVIEKDLNIFELELQKVEAATESLHLHRLLSIQYDRLKYQENYSTKVSKSAITHYNVLEGMNKVTEQMREEYMKLRHMALMSKKVSWGQAHKKEYQTLPTEGVPLPLQIPPRIEEFSTLSFARFDPQMPGDANNISQLNGSKKTLSPSPSTSRYMKNYETLEEFLHDTVGEKRLVHCFPYKSAGEVQACPVESVDFEQHFSPILPIAAGLNTTMDISPTKTALNKTYDRCSTEDFSLMNNAFVGGDGKQTPLNADKLNETFVLQKMAKEVSRQPQANITDQTKTKLKRALAAPTLVTCNKENKFKAPNAALLRVLRLPGPPVPKIAKRVSPRSEMKRTMSQTPNPVRTPLRNVNSTPATGPRFTAKKPFVVARDIPKASPADRSVPRTPRHGPFRTHVKKI